MNTRLYERAEQVKGRLLVRRWELRQQHHAKGVWYRLRRLLAAAEHVYAVSDDDFGALIESGHRLEPVGRELEPERRITAAKRGAVARLPSARELRVALDVQLLSEKNWVLVPFNTAPESAIRKR